MLPQLDISVYFSQLFWLSVCVSTLIIAFKKCFIPRINRLISERNAFISQKEDNIQKLEIELRKIEDDIEALKNHGLARSSEIIR
ncbi:MAG: hypothetical protein LBB34_03490, partial [Holosporales bacterium]|nr:hypothetical protein [Holosporales bacterium]